MRTAPVFVTGGTGFLGRTLIEALLARDYPVHALVRPGSEARLATGAVRVTRDALDAVANPPDAGMSIVEVPGARRAGP